MSYVVGKILLSAKELIELAAQHQYDWETQYLQECLQDAKALVEKAIELTKEKE